MLRVIGCIWAGLGIVILRVSTANGTHASDSEVSAPSANGFLFGWDETNPRAGNGVNVGMLQEVMSLDHITQTCSLHIKLNRLEHKTGRHRTLVCLRAYNPTAVKPESVDRPR
ncbi:hypothetical protein V8F06_003351 [Rhypophila decipiens]